MNRTGIVADIVLMIYVISGSAFFSFITTQLTGDKTAGWIVFYCVVAIGLLMFGPFLSKLDSKNRKPK